MVSKPSHHVIAAQNSLGSKCRPGSPEGRAEMPRKQRQRGGELFCWRRLVIKTNESHTIQLIGERSLRGRRLDGDTGKIVSDEETRPLLHELDDDYLQWQNQMNTKMQ